MLKFALSDSISVHKIKHEDPEIVVYVIDDFLENPEELIDYAREKAYFGAVGDDRTAYPGIRDRLPSFYEHVLGEAVSLVFQTQKSTISRCMLSLTTLNPDQLSTAQKMPHIDALGDDQFASVHYLCDSSHGGTAIYRYRPKNIVRLRGENHSVISEMMKKVGESSDEHSGYLMGDTSLFKRELLVEAKLNRLILYPSNLLHCAVLSSPRSLINDVSEGRLSVASFFRLEGASIY
jgi:hypothetical protein